jgi:hypothetical protein
MNAVLTPSDVRFIRRSVLSDRVLATHYGVKRLAILRARTGKTFHNVKTKPSLRRKESI